MMDKHIYIFNTQTDLNQAVADHFAEIVNLSVKSRGVAYVAFSGGGTPQGFFQALAQPPYQTSLPWIDIHVYWVDERSVPVDHPESNFGQVKKTLLDNAPIQLENIHRIHGELNPENAATAYIKELITHACSEHPWPKFDWTLLGLGEDGHTASLFPGQINSSEQKLPVIAITANYQGRPANRVSLTPLILNTSRNVAFMVSGANKARILSVVLNGPYDPVNLPAHRIQPVDGTITWLVDSSAAEIIINKED